MGQRVRHHVNPLAAQYQNPREAVLDLPADRKIDVEIGCAEAQFLFELAAKDPTRFYVGLEIRRELVNWVNERAVKAGLPLRAEFCNVNLDLATLFGAGRVERIFINFPDPCFKEKHKKRRVMNPELVAACHEVLVKDGELLFQSDVFDLALDAMDVLESCDDLFTNLAGAWTFLKTGNPYGVRSTREQICETEGKPIWRILLRRRGP